MTVPDDVREALADKGVEAMGDLLGLAHWKQYNASLAVVDTVLSHLEPVYRYEAGPHVGEPVYRIRKP